MDTIAGEEYYSADEACRILGVKLSTLYSYVNRGLLSSYRRSIHRHRLYRRSEVEALLTVTAVPREEPPIPLAESWAAEH